MVGTGLVGIGVEVSEIRMGFVRGVVVEGRGMSRPCQWLSALERRWLCELERR